MAQILQRALNPCVAPRRILRRHPDDQRSKVRLQTRGTAAPTTISPLPRHELAMPAEDGVRRHECADLRKHAATKPLSKLRETSPLTVLEPQPLPCQPRLQDAILLP